MDPMVFVIILVALLFGGVWGTVVLSGLMRQRQIKLEGEAEGPRFTELVEEHRLLEVRLEQLEEEVGFLRELRRPDARPRLEPGEDETA